MVTIRTLADEKITNSGRTNFNLESLHNGEKYHISNAYAVPKFCDEKDTLSHTGDITTLEHFDGVDTPVAPNRECADILIGQSDKALLTVLEERETKIYTRQTLCSLILGLLQAKEESRMAQINFFSKRFY